MPEGELQLKPLQLTLDRSQWNYRECYLMQELGSQTLQL